MFRTGYIRETVFAYITYWKMETNGLFSDKDFMMVFQQQFTYML